LEEGRHDGENQSLRSTGGWFTPDIASTVKFFLRPVAAVRRGVFVSACRVLALGLAATGVACVGTAEVKVAAATAPASGQAEYSALWGERGEAWTPGGRLPDFSRAGYHEGESPIPVVPQVSSVKDFGAVGDGKTDDTKAFQAALKRGLAGAVFVPPGRYVITDYLRIEQSGVVLRGAGPEQSVLWFPRGLDEVQPREGRTSTGAAASGHSFDGGFVTLQGDYQAKAVAKITALARRGDTSVEVDNAADLRVGQQVLVTLRETAGHSLKTYLYGGAPGDIGHGKMLDTKMLVRVVALDGTRVRFDRPLRFETRAEWRPELRSFKPTVTESGVEGLGFEFPATRYRGHFRENGANAVELRSVYNCWVRNISIRNGDLGVNLVACGNTLDGLVYTADPGRGSPEGGIDCTGHHAVQCKNAEDNLVTHFDVRTPFIHDLSVEHASGNVFAQGRGVNLCFDHHKDTPYENLFTDIDCGLGTRVWRCGGGAGLGRQSAGWETFWNIRAARMFDLPSKGWGAPSMNFIGLTTKAARAADSAGIWVEPGSSPKLQPADLHAAQLARRLTQRP
jgi:hypothetical protein